MSPGHLSPPLEALTRAYGPPSSAGFGSAVFSEAAAADQGLEATARRCYRTFVGQAWERFGEAAWLGAWQLVYQRPAGGPRAVVAELEGIRGPAASSVDLLLNVVQGAEQARTALAGVYDAATVTDLRVFSIGDGAALSGVLVAGLAADGSATVLVLLMD